jgi:hypothetical protein
MIYAPGILLALFSAQVIIVSEARRLLIVVLGTLFGAGLKIRK